MHKVGQVAHLRQTDKNCFSVYAKAAERTFIELALVGDSGSVTAMFNLTTGAVVNGGIDNSGNGDYVRARIEDIGNGWYRCYVSGICDTEGGYGVTGEIRLSSDGSVTSYLGNGTNGVLIFGAQVEKATRPSGYLKTESVPLKSYLRLDDMPEMEDGKAVDEDEVWEAYDKDSIEFPGEWNTDSRIALVAQSPRPCTVLAAVVDMKTSG